MVDAAVPPPPSAQRRWLRRSAWALAAVALLWLVSWLAVPPLLAWQLQKQASAALGRAVTVSRVDFRPWSLRLRIEGLRVATADGQGEQFALDALELDAELQSLLRRAPVIDALSLEAPRLQLRHRGGGRLDVDDVLNRLRPSPDAPDDASRDPARFAVFNIRLSAGAVTLVDEPVGVTHALDGLELSVPFLSNIGSRREVQTEPRLAFRLNGSAFESSASTAPFADDRRTRARLELPALDLAPYLPYWPTAWPVRPTAGVLHADLAVDFEQHDTPSVAVSGRVALSGLRVDEQRPGAAARPLLGWERLELDLQRVEPLQQRAHLAALRWQQPRLALHRDADGTLALQRIARAFAPPGPPAAPREATAPAPWQGRLDRVSIDGATVTWADAAVQPAVAIALSALDLKAADIAWPMATPVPLEASAALDGVPVRARGTASDRRAQIAFEHEALPLALAAPYLAQVLRPAVAGALTSRGELLWQAASAGEPGLLALRGGALTISDLRVGPARQPQLQWARLDVEEAEVDLVARRVGVGRLRLDQPRADLARDEQGRLPVQDWPVAGPGAAAPAPAGDPAPPWAVTLADVQVSGGRLRWRDALPPRPVDLRVDALDLRLQNLQPLARPQPEMPLRVSARIAAAGQDRADPGRLALDGRLRLPLAGSDPALRGQLRVERFPVHGLEPYLAERLNMELLRADASYRGALSVAASAAGLSLSLAGDAALEDVQAHTLAPAEPLLNWTSLQVRGIELEQAPGRALRVAVRETVLSDYFARVIIAPDGRINLQGLLKPAAAPDDAAPATSSTAASAAAPDIRIGPVSLLGGRVLFSDRFIQPNYTANLSELTGTLSAFQSAPGAPGQAPPMAELSLKGRAEGTASLDISGRLNPLARPLALDIKGVVRDLELPPLSPYTAKYAGHGIERGKLSVDVSYRIEPDGQLTASNQIVLNQLDFGERIAGSSAPNLPLKLAVALLSDRDGVIDINLPVSGSINDPQFRLAPIIVKLILNLIGKALTAPFALIANAFGGGGTDASQVAFEPGRAELSAAGRDQLDAVARALLNRPALQLTVVGHSDAQTERAGLQRARLDALLLAEKRRALARSGAPVPAELAVVPDERPALLREVYRRADMPKPRNLIGIAKDIPLPEMEALLLAAQPVNDEALRALAVARAVAVKDHLASRQLPESRLFLGAPRTTASGPDWKPQAELRLAPR